MLNRRMRLVSVALTSMLVVGVSAQCVRPTPPASGLPVDRILAVPVTYSDGYTTFGSLVMPVMAPPQCGWPLVVYVHPLGGSRFDEAALQLLMAEQGYAVWSYDVRGQGQAVAANVGHPSSGSTLWGPIELHDLAEQIDFVATHAGWQGVIDAGRLGVIGTSQGGAHAWMAAAWSGEWLTTPGRTSMPFPFVRCALPRDLVANSVDDWLRHGELFSSWWVEALAGSYAGLPLDPELQQEARTAFLLQDPESLQGAWMADGRDMSDRLAASTVPVIYNHAYLDSISSPMSGLAALEGMQGPVRSMLSTLGHGVPANHLERVSSDNLTLRWLHRFLWGHQNEVELEPPHQLAMLPLSSVERDDLAHAWRHSNLHGLTPPAGANRLYLYGDFELRAAVPVAPQSVARIEQIVAPSATTFNPTDYFDQPSARTVSSVLAACPLDEKVWAMTVLEESQVDRSASLHLELTPDAPSWMVAALLTVEPIGGDEVLLASDVIASRNSVPGEVELHDLRLPPIAASCPAGSVLRLRLRNLWLREFPMQQSLSVAPLFTDFGVDIQPAGSWVDLPIRPVTAKLVVDRRVLALDTAPQVSGTVHGGQAHRGDPYFVAVGLSGIVPSTSYLGELVPLDGDWLVVASAGSTQVYYAGFIGLLDSNGDATCTLDYSLVAPLPQALNGYSLTMAAFIWDGLWAPTGEATNACEIMMR